MTKIIYGGGLLICLLIAALFWQLVQTRDLNSRLICEIRELRIQANTHDARIKAMADEQAWVREKVRISVDWK